MRALMFLASPPPLPPPPHQRRPILPIPAPLFNQPPVLFTDGSWRRTRSGPFFHQSSTSAGAALAIMDGSSLILGLRLANAYALQSQRAYVQEHVGLLLAAAVSQELGLASPIFTDCRSAKDYILNPSTNQQSLNPLGQLASFTRHLLRSPDLRWIRSHSALPFEEQSSAQQGNTIADAISAGAHPNFIDLPMSTLSIIADNTNRWYLHDTESNLPAMLGLSKSSNATLHSYLSDRSQRHPLSPTPTEIQQLMISIQPSSSKQAGAYLKLALRKFDDDRRAASTSPADYLPPCSCGCSNTIDTWVTTCRHPESLAIRNGGLNKVRDHLEHYPLLRAYILGALTSPTASAQEWRGIWSEPHYGAITDIMLGNYPSLVEKDWSGGVRLLHQVIQTTTSTSLQLHSYHRKGLRAAPPKKAPYKPSPPLLRPPRKVPVPQPKITKFFLPRNSSAPGQTPSPQGLGGRVFRRFAHPHTSSRRRAPLPCQEIPRRRAIIATTPSISSFLSRQPTFLISPRTLQSGPSFRREDPLRSPGSRLSSRELTGMPASQAPDSSSHSSTISSVVQSVNRPCVSTLHTVNMPVNYHALLDSK